MVTESEAHQLMLEAQRTCHAFYDRDNPEAKAIKGQFFASLYVTAFVS